LNCFILNIETSTKVCSVALQNGSNLVGERIDLSEGYSHAERLATMIKDLLDGFSVLPSELSAIAVSEGPGSYTGLRIGVSTAKGMAYALGIPLISVGSLHTLAKSVNENDFAANHTEKVLAVMDARRNEVYACTFLKGEPISDVKPKVLDTDELDSVQPNEKIILIGDGAQKVKDLKPNYEFVLLPEKIILASCMTEVALEKFNSKQFEDTAYFEPDYLKPFFTGGHYVT
jgi:tRNA threonylcarbamoyladenosine biosynthesis protein TsaB